MDLKKKKKGLVVFLIKRMQRNEWKWWTGLAEKLSRQQLVQIGHNWSFPQVEGAGVGRLKGQY